MKIEYKIRLLKANPDMKMVVYNKKEKTSIVNRFDLNNEEQKRILLPNKGLNGNQYYILALDEALLNLKLK